MSTIRLDYDMIYDMKDWRNDVFDEEGEGAYSDEAPADGCMYRNCSEMQHHVEERCG